MLRVRPSPPPSMGPADMMRNRASRRRLSTFTTGSLPTSHTRRNRASLHQSRPLHRRHLGGPTITTLRVARENPPALILHLHCLRPVLPIPLRDNPTALAQILPSSQSSRHVRVSIVTGPHNIKPGGPSQNGSIRRARCHTQGSPAQTKAANSPVTSTKEE